MRSTAANLRLSRGLPGLEQLPLESVDLVSIKITWFQSTLLHVYFNMTNKDRSAYQISLNQVYGL